MPNIKVWGPGPGQGIRDDEQYVYPTRDVPGALAKGTLIEKVNSGQGDSFPDCTRGRVLGSEMMGGLVLFYCVEWDAAPGVPIWINADRTRPL